jgi:adenosine deaminase
MKSNVTTAFHPPEPSAALLALPKCNIHTHLEGSVRPGTFLELAAQQGISLPFDPLLVREKLQVDGSEKTLVDYLAKIMINYSVLKRSAALQRVAFEAAEDAHRDGVIYLELRAGPATHASPDFPIEAGVESMLAGLQEAQTKFGITCRLIVAALRNHAPETNLHLARIAVRYAQQGVVGFDLAGDEAGYPADLHQEAYKIVRAAGLGLTVHAGEASGAEAVRYAVEALQAQRIGHGVHSIESRPVMDLLRERQILLEICPTSNIHTGAVSSIDAHPLKTLYEYGIPISINDDDPITSCTRASNELMLVHTLFGISLETIVSIQLTTLEHSFLRDQSLKERLKAQLSSLGLVKKSPVE